MFAVNVFDRTALARDRSAYALEQANRAIKCAATLIELSDREREILCPALLEPISCLETELAETLVSLGASVLITDVLPSGENIGAWRDQIAGPLIIAVLRNRDAGAAPHVDSFSDDDLIVCQFDRHTVSLQQALCKAEHIRAQRDPVLCGPAVYRSEHPAGKSVAVIGAGIVSLISALEFARAGYAVDIFEKSPDPRGRPDWTSMGCTHGGEGVRMFSLTECDNYHERTGTTGRELHQFINTGLDNMGWGLGEENRFDAGDLTWKAEFRDVPIFLADHYNEDIFALNHESYRLWRDMMEAEPSLFEDAMLTEGLLRICRTEAYHHKQLQRQKHVRTFVRELDRADLVEAYPALETGCANGEIHGGIEVEGFTLDIHRFVRNVLDAAQRLGITFHWSTPVEEILYSGGAVSGIRVDGASRRADPSYDRGGAAL